VPHGWARGARFPASCSPACARSCARCLGLPGEADGKTSPALGDLVLSNFCCPRKHLMKTGESESLSRRICKPVWSWLPFLKLEIHCKTHEW
jgi:hypothetical protein